MKESVYWRQMKPSVILIIPFLPDIHSSLCNVTEPGWIAGPQVWPLRQTVPDWWLYSLQAGTMDKEVTFLPGAACWGKYFNFET